MAARIVQLGTGYIASDIKDAEPLYGGELRSDLGNPGRHLHVDDGKIGLLVPAKPNRLVNCASDATDLVIMLYQHVFDHVRDHDVVLDYQNLQRFNVPVCAFAGASAKWLCRTQDISESAGFR